MARFKTLGMDSFTERLEEIAAWYSDVSDAYSYALENGYTDSAKEFYRSYYYDLAKCSSNAYDVFNTTYNARGIVLQGQVNGKRLGGRLGSGCRVFGKFRRLCRHTGRCFGLSSTEYRTLTVEPSLRTGLNGSNWKTSRSVTANTIAASAVIL